MENGLPVIVSPGNMAWVCIAAAFALAGIPIYFKLREKSYAQKRKTLLMMASANLALFILYLLWFQYAPGAAFFRWSILPVNLCNILTILFVVALATDKKELYCFCFYVGIAAGIMAILSPEGGLKEMELFSPLMIGFYFVHCMLYLMGILLVALGLYRPDYKSALWAVVYLEALTVVIYIVNLILRGTVYPEANFFFLFETNDSPYLEALHSVAPVPPFTMMVSALPVALALFLLSTWVYKMAVRRKQSLK